MADDEDQNIFQKLKDKFKLAVKKVDLNNLPDGVREQCVELEQYRNVLFELYLDLMRILNGNPEYDPTIRKEDAYYVANDSPGEKFCAHVGQLSQLMWDGLLPGYSMRLGLEISEMEKILQRDARKQLFYLREFLFKEYPKFEKIRTECLVAKNKFEVLDDRKKKKAGEEYERHLGKVQEFLVQKVPDAKKNHVRCLLYFMRCYRHYHVSLRVRYAGIATIKVPRPGTQRF